MKPIDVKSDSYAEYNVDSKDKDSKFKLGDHIRISTYKTIFARGYAPNWSEEIFIISKIKIQFHGHINDLYGEKIVRTFYEKELKEKNQGEFRIEKIIKRKGDKLCVKWKGYGNYLIVALIKIYCMK